MEDHQALSLLKKIKSDLDSENHHFHSTYFLTQQEQKRQKASEYQFVCNKFQFKKRRQQEKSKRSAFSSSSSLRLKNKFFTLHHSPSSDFY
jgi:hypothetical protein